MDSRSLQHTFENIRANRFFEWSIIFIIIFSALLIGAKTYQLSPVVEKIIQGLDFAVTLFFLSELVVRFIAEPQKSRFFLKGWNIFDTVIVVVSLIPINDTEMAVIGRLIRIFRVLRMVSIIPELRTLLNSLLKALPQLGYVIGLMFIIFYIYGAIGTTFFSKINPELWGDISISMLTLFRVMTFEDWTDVMYETMVLYPLSWTFYLSFIFLTAFAFLNMVIGIVVNVLEKENAKEREEANGPQPTLVDLQHQLSTLQGMLEKQQKPML